MYPAKQLELLYNSTKMCKDYSNRGIKLGEKLQWDKVTDIWVNELNAIPLDFKEDRFKDIDPEIVTRELEKAENRQMNLKYLP